MRCEQNPVKIGVFGNEFHFGDSAYVDETQMPTERLLWPELVDCQSICVANKQHNDTVYFAGVNVDQLLFFFDRVGYPPEIVDFTLNKSTSLLESLICLARIRRWLK